MPDKSIGTLYVVATPIGNLNDMTYRAVTVLQSADKILAEDTRHAAPLLKHYGIRASVMALHEFNERERVNEVVEMLEQGESLALISDAGTPLISDPGFRLVREAKKAGVEVVAIPGACAAVAALSVAGLPTDRFIFEGFLPPKDQAREKYLQGLVHEERTLIFYEAPRRLVATLQAMVDVFGGDRQAVVARELTKMHESVKLAPLSELLIHYEQTPEELRGEVVLLLAGRDDEAATESGEQEVQHVLQVLLAELPLKQAVSLACKITGQRKNAVYDLALSLKK